MGQIAARLPAAFRCRAEVYHADTCAPVRAALRRGEIRVSALAQGSYPGRRLPADRLPSICSVGSWDAPHDLDWGLDWHRNEGIEFTFLSRGRLGFSVEDRSWTLRRGDLTITRPWQAHRVGNPHVSASRLLWLILDVGVRRPHQPWHWPEWLVCSREDLRRLTTLLSQNEQPVWSAGSAVERSFEEVAAAVDGRPGPSAETRLKLAINQLLVSILEMLHRKRIPLDRSLAGAERTVRLFLEQLRGRVGELWTLDSMAEECGLGRSRFAYYCRRLTNMTPLELLARTRVGEAARMLRRNPRARVTDVALSCGFASSQYFATVFRRFTARSPGQFRLA